MEALYLGGGGKSGPRVGADLENGPSAVAHERLGLSAADPLGVVSAGIYGIDALDDAAPIDYPFVAVHSPHLLSPRLAFQPESNRLRTF